MALLVVLTLPSPCRRRDSGKQGLMSQRWQRQICFFDIIFYHRTAAILVLTLEMGKETRLKLSSGREIAAKDADGIGHYLSFKLDKFAFNTRTNLKYFF